MTIVAPDPLHPHDGPLKTPGGGALSKTKGGAPLSLKRDMEHSQSPSENPQKKAKRAAGGDGGGHSLSHSFGGRGGTFAKPAVVLTEHDEGDDQSRTRQREEDVRKMNERKKVIIQQLGKATARFQEQMNIAINDATQLKSTFESEINATFEEHRLNLMEKARVSDAVEREVSKIPSIRHE